MKIAILSTCLLLAAPAFAQKNKVRTFDLQNLLSQNKLDVASTISPLKSDDKRGVSCKGIVWLKDERFSKGVIEIDLRGKDILQQSFLGIAFHGIDTATYDAIYFRPFNFRAEDPERKVHAVQYISAPDFHWDRLRKEHHGVYEKGIVPPPGPDQWFHARIEVGDTTIKVFVNKSSTPSLIVQKLNSRKNGLIGLWSTKQGVDGDFANLTISDETSLN
jgi:hypothetical protein